MTSWFPIGRDDSGGWRLDIVALLAVTGESFIGEHAQALTSSKLCLLPRIMPAPHALLQPRRPASLPRETAKVCGVYSGIVLDTLSFFANIIHPIDQLRPFEFKVLEIRHNRDKNVRVRRTVNPPRDAPSDMQSGLKETKDSQTTATGATAHPDPERGDGIRLRRAPTMQERITQFASNAPTVLLTKPTKEPGYDSISDLLTNPAMAPGFDRGSDLSAYSLSPLHLLSVFSFFLTIGLVVAGVLWKDGAAVLAVVLISIATSTISYAAWWRPMVLSRASSSNNVPRGDMMIRTREGAFLLIRCTEDVARELYSGVDECYYIVTGVKYRLLMTLGGAFLMPSVILLGNCTFNMQALVGGAFLVLNIAYWAIGLLPLRASWDLSRYEVRDVTPPAARNAHQGSWDDTPSFTRTLWYAICQTKDAAWAQRSGCYPSTPQWRMWVREAVEAAKAGNYMWDAVARKDEIMKHARDDAQLDEVRE